MRCHTRMASYGYKHFGVTQRSDWNMGVMWLGLFRSLSRGCKCAFRLTYVRIIYMSLDY